MTEFEDRGTDHFWHEGSPRRPYLRLEWIKRVLDDPEQVERQADGRVKYWRYIAEIDRFCAWYLWLMALG